jgi:hypothetical protein
MFMRVIDLTCRFPCWFGRHQWQLGWQMPSKKPGGVSIFDPPHPYQYCYREIYGCKATRGMKREGFNQRRVMP